MGRPAVKELQEELEQTYWCMLTSVQCLSIHTYIEQYDGLQGFLRPAQCMHPIMTITMEEYIGQPKNK
jgi:hypothetical protein